MNCVQKTELERELAAAGASRSELASLSNIAVQLGNLPDHERNARYAQKLRPIFMAGVSALCSLVIGILLVISAQAARPDSLLYPIQKASDSIIIAMNPAYKGTVMMKRADQVEELVAEQAPPGAVVATLADYQQLAVSYKATKSNYAEFEYCKHSLEQAASIAPAAERQAIYSSLASLSKT